MPRPTSESWLVLLLEPPPPGREPLVAHALRQAGARAMEREGQRLAAWFLAPESAERLAARVRAALRAATGGSELDMSWRRVSREEWNVHRVRSAAPMRVTERLVVVPPEGEPPAGAGTVLWLAPGAAFGDARHPTTRAALTLLESQVRPGDQVLDVGTGSGILAMAAALLGAGAVRAVDADPLACQEARENLALNRLQGRVDVIQGTFSADHPPAGSSHDGVVANLDGPSLLPLLPALGASVRPGGWLVVAGLVVPERAMALEALDRARCSLADERGQGGWWSAAFRRETTRPPSFPAP